MWSGAEMKLAPLPATLVSGMYAMANTMGSVMLLLTPARTPASFPFAVGTGQVPSRGTCVPGQDDRNGIAFVLQGRK